MLLYLYYRLSELLPVCILLPANHPNRYVCGDRFAMVTKPVIAAITKNGKLLICNEEAPAAVVKPGVAVITDQPTIVNIKCTHMGYTSPVPVGWESEVPEQVVWQLVELSV